MLDLNRINTGQKLIDDVLKRQGLKVHPSTRLQQLKTHDLRKPQTTKLPKPPNHA